MDTILWACNNLHIVITFSHKVYNFFWQTFVLLLHGWSNDEELCQLPNKVQVLNDTQNKPIYSLILFEKKDNILIDLLIYITFWANTTQKIDVDFLQCLHYCMNKIIGAEHKLEYALYVHYTLHYIFLVRMMFWLEIEQHFCKL